jgi:DNA-directed RNA polymerase II subunit RPB11
LYFRQLLALPEVLFAGYLVPHPLEPYFILKVQTDGTVTPTAAFRTACHLLLATVTKLQAEFKREFEFQAFEDEPGAGAGGGTGIGGYGDAYGTTGTGVGGRMRTQDYADF